MLQSRSNHQCFNLDLITTWRWTDSADSRHRHIHSLTRAEQCCWLCEGEFMKLLRVRGRRRGAADSWDIVVLGYHKSNIKGSRNMFSFTNLSQEVGCSFRMICLMINCTFTSELWRFHIGWVFFLFRLHTFSPSLSTSRSSSSSWSKEAQMKQF